MEESKQEDKQWWIFTFGQGHEHEDYYVKIFGTFRGARDIMFSKYGEMWAFQYTEEEWSEWEKKRPKFLKIEQLLEEINEFTDDYEYECNVEQLQHDILYESTFNPEDGSM